MASMRERSNWTASSSLLLVMVGSGIHIVLLFLPFLLGKCPA